MRILITGVAGFLGSHLADAFLADGHEVVGVDNLIGGDLANVPEGVMLWNMSCQDLPRSLHVPVDVVYHCAATAYEGLSVFSPTLVTDNIVQATVATITAAIQNGAKRFVYCSSMARYGRQQTPYAEHMDTHPVDPYGIGKVAGEQMLRCLAEVHGMEWVVAVPHNIIGPRQKYDDPYRNVASIMINRMLQGQPPIIYGDGTQRRCFSYVDDVVGVLKKLATVPEISGMTFNVGPDEGSVTINELAATLNELLGTRLDPIYVTGRPQEVHEAVCSSNRIRFYFDYKTKWSLRDGLAVMIDAIRRQGVRPFNYHLPVEIQTALTPETWTKRLI